MPLNIKDTDQRGEKPEPIVHHPEESNPYVRKLLVIIFGGIVLLAVIFLLYSYMIVGGKRTPSSTTVTQSTDTNAQVHAEDTSTAQLSPNGKSSLQGNAQPKFPGMSATGKCAIYISSYTVRGDAEEEVGRWQEAGFDAFVDETPGWFRVSLGHYSAVTEAKHDAEELKEAFEYGYWIGPI
jgi:cell division protein FtsN